MQYVERSTISLDWITVLIVCCIVILAISKALYPKRFNDFIKLTRSDNYFLRREEKISHPFNLLLLFIQFLSISLFLNFIILERPNTNPILFIQLITGLIVFILVKLMIEKMIGAIFSIEDIIDQYVYKKLVYRSFLSLLLLVLSIIFYYIFNPNQQTLLVFIGFLVFFNSIFLYFSYKRHRSLLFGNFFYFLLYLCALEISPYVILYKALV